ncbi:PepSY domain-containing protein [Hoeflea sp. TYP-13]|uniref:PepSY domain-containing protein n=1 Tax=Hoeflea sp. TYP-13 TaxID=3230023 RepID=UPI0034C681DA
MNTKLTLVSIAAIASIAGTVAFADDETPSKQAPAIGYDRAVEIATNAHPGMVSETEYEREDGRDVVVVEVVTETGTMEVVIDAANGDIISAEAEDDDKEDDKG